MGSGSGGSGIGRVKAILPSCSSLRRFSSLKFPVFRRWRTNHETALAVSALPTERCSEKKKSYSNEDGDRVSYLIIFLASKENKL